MTMPAISRRHRESWPTVSAKLVKRGSSLSLQPRHPGACRGCSRYLSGVPPARSAIDVELPGAVFDGQLAGTSVELSIAPGTLLIASCLVYLLPVLLMLCLSAGCSLFMSQSEPAVALFGLAGLVAGFVVARSKWCQSVYAAGWKTVRVVSTN